MPLGVAHITDVLIASPIISGDDMGAVDMGAQVAGAGAGPGAGAGAMPGVS